MPAHSTPDQIADHFRDHRKHEPRASDPLPARFATPIATSLEIAVLAKTVSVTQAAALIEQYAKTYASGAVLEAVEMTSNRILAAMESPLTRRQPL